MSRSYHATETSCREDRWLNRDDEDRTFGDLSKLDEILLKKIAAKETENWRRAASEAGAIRHYVFKHTYEGWRNNTQRCRGILSAVNSEPNQTPEPIYSAVTSDASASAAPSAPMAHL